MQTLLLIVGAVILVAGIVWAIKKSTNHSPRGRDGSTPERPTDPDDFQ